MPGKKIRYSKLIELSNSGYEIVAGEPDIRKWKVRNATGKYLGVVDELLVDRQLNKIRYIVLNLEGKPLNLLPRKLLIPIGIAEFDEMDDVVILPGITIEHLATLPTYKKSKLSIETERKIGTIFSRSNVSEDCDENDNGTDDVFYEHEHFNERNLHSRKKNFERPGNDLIGQGNPVNTDPSKQVLAPFQEGVIEITEHSEVPVVSKEARVVEEISVNKDVTEHNEKVKDSVRKTEVEIENLNR